MLKTDLIEMSEKSFYVFDLLYKLSDFPINDIALSLFKKELPEVITYGELDERVHKAMQILLQKGINRQDRICIVLDCSIDLVIWLIASIKLAVVPCILPYHFARYNKQEDIDRLLHLFQKLKSRTIICNASLTQLLKNRHSTINFELNSIPADDLLNIDINFKPIETCPPHNENISYIQMSSGTTGAQKGIKLSYRAINSSLNAISNKWKLSIKNDVVLNWLPLYHDMSLFCGLFLPLVEGIPICLAPPSLFVKKPHLFFQKIALPLIH